MKFDKEAIQKFSSKIKGKDHAKNTPFVFESYFREYNKQRQITGNYLIFRCKCN